MENFIGENLFGIIALIMFGYRFIKAKIGSRNLNAMIAEIYTEMSDEALIRTVDSYKVLYESEAPGKLKIKNIEPLEITRSGFSLMIIFFYSSIIMILSCLSLGLIYFAYMMSDLYEKMGFWIFLIILPIPSFSFFLIYKLIPPKILDLRAAIFSALHMKIDDFGIRIDWGPYALSDPCLIDFHELKGIRIDQDLRTGDNELIFYDQHEDVYRLNQDSLEELEWLKMVITVRFECARRGLKHSELLKNNPTDSSLT